MTTRDPDTSPEFAAALEAALRDTSVRVKPFEAGGKRYWLKRIERYRSPVKRLGKGAASRVFAREGAILRRLAARGVPVPAILAEGPDWRVLEDCGPTLEDMAHGADYDPACGRIAFAAAGAALARLHGAGLTHGRGKTKDFCWDGARIRFIDFEAESPPFVADTTGRDDLVRFVFNAHFVGFHAGRDLSGELSAFIDAYRVGGDMQVLRAARRWARGRWWMIAPAAPVAWLTPPRKAPDFKAVAPSIRFLSGLDTG